jgi:hypothetical protein
MRHTHTAPGFTREGTAAHEILLPAVKCALELQCIAPKGATRATHHYDQSVWTLLAYQSGFTCQPMNVFCNPFMWDVTSNRSATNHVVIAARRHRFPYPYIHDVQVNQSCHYTPPPSPLPAANTGGEGAGNTGSQQQQGEHGPIVTEREPHSHEIWYRYMGYYTRNVQSTINSAWSKLCLLSLDFTAVFSTLCVLGARRLKLRLSRKGKTANKISGNPYK